MENIFVEFLPPWVETGLQPAFYDKESGTVLQQTARMYARVNMLIRMFNKLSKNTKTEIEQFETSVNHTVDDYIEQFNQLHDYVHDYFDNLDVQEEINNKLDAMQEAGTLQEIITTYIQSNVAWTFDSVAEMQSATNLIDGSYARTLGYYNVNDGGGALYHISESEPSGYYETLTSGLYAEIVIEDTMNIKQFGAKGDGTTDDKNAIQNALNTRSKIIIPESTNPYMLSGVVQVYNDVTFYGTLKIIETTGLAGTSCLLIQDYQDDKILHITNPLIDGNRDTTQPYELAGIEFSYGIDIKGSKNLVIEGGSIINCQGDSICIGASTTNRWCENIEINNLYCDQPFRNCLSIVSGVDIRINNCTMYNRNGYRCTLVEPNPDNTLKNGKIVFDGGYYYSNAHYTMASYASADIADITYKNLTVENSSNALCPLHASQPTPINKILKNLRIENVTIINENELTEIPLRTENNIVIDGLHINSKFKYISLSTSNATITNTTIDIDNSVTSAGNILANASKISVSNCRFNMVNSSSNYSGLLAVTNADEVIIDHNLFLNNTNAISIGQSSGASHTTNEVIVTNNIFTANDSSSRRGLNIIGGVTITSLLFTDNIAGENLSFSLYRLDNGTVVKATGNNIITPKVYYGTSAPATGTYIKGDTVINSSPSSGGAYGWVCVVAGTPGTWKVISTIA